VFLIENCFCIFFILFYLFILKLTVIMELNLHSLLDFDQDKKKVSDQPLIE